MRLEPVYLLAPEPAKPPTRRRVLWLAAFGLSAGMFGWGFLAGRNSVRSEPTGHDADTAILAHAVALSNSDERTLLEHRAQILYACALSEHSTDAAVRSQLLDGIRRLAELAAREPDAATSIQLTEAERKTLARQILGIVESDAADRANLPSAWLDSLRSIAR